MFVVNVTTKEKYKVKIDLLKNKDYKNLTKQRYFFDWKKEQNHEVYGLCLENETDFLGLVSIERIPDEWRIHIRLLTVSRENKGKNKKYENIIGNILTYISKIAIQEYAELACVSLIPKGAIAQHYIDKFKMNITGKTLSIELKEILNWIKIYDND